MAVRYSESRFDAVERTAGGLLKVAATPTRTGVFVYRRADGTEVRELRHPDEVFHADSLASLEDVPVTMGHPRGNVTPAQFAAVTAGHVRAGSVAKHEDGQRVKASVVLGRQDAIDGAERKTHSELSAGYTCAIDPTPGEYQGQRYDQAQTRIRYNHVAMLEPGKGRMGRECRLDAAGEEIVHEDRTDTEPPMKITINGKTYETEADAQKAVTELAARADAAEAQVKTLTETVARHDAEAATARHAALVSKVQATMGSGFSVVRKDEKGTEVPLTARELRLAVIKRADSSFDEKGRDDTYIEARFDATLATASKASAVIEALNASGSREPNAAVRADASDVNSPAALVKAKLESAKKNGVAVAE